MNELELNESFWNQRYHEGTTGWDLGEISPPLKSYFEQLDNTDLKILIPGAGNAYEAEYLLQNDFKKVTVLDWSQMALDNLQSRTQQLGVQAQLIQSDFFKHSGQYDLIVEQTFFCAIDPSLRSAYVKKMHDLLSANGKLVGLMFNVPLNTEHPPFGGNINEYRTLFEPYFNIEIMEPAYNSLAARQDSELFIKMIKR